MIARGLPASREKLLCVIIFVVIKGGKIKRARYVYGLQIVAGVFINKRYIYSIVVYNLWIEYGERKLGFNYKPLPLVSCFVIRLRQFRWNRHIAVESISLIRLSCGYRRRHTGRDVLSALMRRFTSSEIYWLITSIEKNVTSLQPMVASHWKLERKCVAIKTWTLDYVAVDLVGGRDVGAVKQRRDGPSFIHPDTFYSVFFGNRIVHRSGRNEKANNQQECRWHVSNSTQPFCFL